MSTPLDVLILEDRESDARLMVHELRRAGYEPHWRRVDTEADYMQALDASFDLVLADYHIPGWDTLRALTVLKERGLDVPFIIVSGSIGEDDAVSAIRDGAADYLLKDRLARLGPAVQQALERARLTRERATLEREHATERERAGQALRASEERLRDLFDNANDLIQSVGPDGRFQFVSRSWQKALGYSAEEAAQMTLFDVVAPSAREHCHDLLARGAGEAFSLEVPLRAKDGREFLVEGHVTCRIEDGAPVATRGIFRDVTESRRAAQALADSERHYRLLFEANPNPMWVYDVGTLGFLAVNEAAIAHYGYSREEFLAMTIEKIRPEEDLATLHRHLAETAPGVEHAGVWRHRKRDGALIEAEVISHPIDFAGRRARLVLAHDVSERMLQERKITRLNRIRSTLVAATSAMLRSRTREALLNEACRVAATNSPFPIVCVGAVDPITLNATFVAYHSALPRTVAYLKEIQARIPEQERPTARVLASNRAVIVNDFATEPIWASVREDLLRHDFRSGAAFPLRIKGRVVAVLFLVAAERGFFDAEEVALLETLSDDLSFALEGIETAERLQYLTLYDRLTDLPNNALFHDRLHQFVMSARARHRRVCLVVLDLVGFTRINETFGRAAGDGVLREVAARLTEAVGPGVALTHVGADSFAVAKACDTEQCQAALLDRVFAGLSSPINVDGKQVAISAQAGLAVFPTDGNDAETLFRNAELALKQIQATTERFRFYSHEINARATARAVLEAELRVAIGAGQLVLHYQPKANLFTGELDGAEALIRWQHPRKGLLAPARFIALAEETGLIAPLGDWVIGAACAQQAAWRAARLGVVPVAVNLSPVQLRQGEALLGTVRDTLQRHALEPTLLDLELTESAVMVDPEEAVATLRALRGLGVGLALDDFGTGYSSLAHLKRFPFTVVKIDRAFVKDVTRNPEDAAIADAVVAMAHRLGLKVVAEGIETKGQLAYLRAQGCDEMQGDYFSPAVSAEVFETFLRTRKHLDLPVSAPDDQHTLLIVDDEQGVRAAITRVLRREGYRVLLASSGPEALELLAVHPVQVIISDQRMVPMSGTEFLSIASRLHPDTMRIILSGYTDLAVVTEAVNRGAVFKFLTKPWDDEQLRAQVREAFQKCRAKTA